MLPREKITEALRLEPFLAIPQIARLFYSVGKDGQPVKSLRIRPKKTSKTVYNLEPGYFPASRILRAMRKDKQVVKHEIPVPGAVAIYALPGRKPPRNWYNREHELDCGDAFVALAKTGKLAHWDSEWTDDEYQQFAQRFGVNYDRRFELKDSETIYFLEVDRGTETFDVLADKAKKYIKLARAFPQQHISVLFTMQGYQGQDVRKRTEKLIQHAIQPTGRSDLFLVSPQVAFLADPLGPVCITPKDWNKSVSLR